MSGILSKWSEPAIRVLMMPRDTNAHGTVFGGVILSYIDVAGGVDHSTRRRLASYNSYLLWQVRHIALPVLLMRSRPRSDEAVPVPELCTLWQVTHDTE